MTGLVFSLPIMLVVRCVFGIGEAAFPSASWKTIATYFPSSQRATATAIQSCVNALGPALATMAAASIISMFGWRHVFVVLGLPGLLIALALYLYVRNDPKDHPGMSAEELKELEEDPGIVSLSASGQEKPTFGQLMRQPILWQMVIIWFAFDITYWGFVSWLPSYLIKGRGFSLAELGLLGSLPFFVGTVALIIGGFFSDNLKAKGVHRKWIFIPTCAIAAIALYVTFKAETVTGSVTAQCVAAFFLFLAFAAFWGIVVDSIPPAIMGAGSATVNFGGQMAGIVAGWAVGKLIDLNGGSFEWAFFFLMGGTILALLVALTIKNEKPAAAKS